MSFSEVKIDYVKQKVEKINEVLNWSCAPYTKIKIFIRNGIDRFRTYNYCISRNYLLIYFACGRTT